MDSKLAKLEEKIDKLADKLDDTNDRISGVDKGLAIYNEQLKIHISGTIDNRNSISKLDHRLEPLESQSKFVANVVLFVKLAGTLAAFVLGTALTLKELGII